MKILVVDDEKLLVKGMKFNLENEGYEVECAYDGAAAVELARKDSLPGDEVLFSPASASFDLYPNFEVRGQHFKRLVNELK